MILSFTENGEVPLIFLVMTLFGKCIQLKFSLTFLSEIYILVFSAVFSNEFLHCSTCVVRD